MLDSAVRPSAIARPAEASAFLHRRVYPDFAGNYESRWPRWLGLGTVGLGCVLSGSPLMRGCWHVGLRVTNVLAGCHIIRYTEAARAEEPEQAAALL
jgi:hypothetical protein